MPYIDWFRLTPFTDCDKSLKFVRFMRDYAYRNSCPIEARCDKIETIDKKAFVDADEARFIEKYDAYEAFAKDKYPIHYEEANYGFKSMRKRILQILNNMRKYGRVNFKTMNMSGENDSYDIVVKIGDEMTDIKKAIIKDKHNNAIHTHNVSLFIADTEDAITAWSPDYMGESFFCLASAGNAKPLTITGESYEVDDRVLYIADNYAGTGGAHSRLAVGFIKTLGGGFMKIQEVEMNRLTNSFKIAWDKPLYTQNGNNNNLSFVKLADIINIQRWDSENPLYDDDKCWVDNTNLPTIKLTDKTLN